MARPPKFDDEEILARAMTAIWRRGWSATSIRDLEHELNLKAPAIYRRFGSKDGLARAVLERYIEQVVRRRLRRYLPGSGDPISNVHAFFESAVSPPSADEPLAGCLLTTMSFDVRRLDPALTDVVAAGLAEIEDALRTELERAAVDHRLAGDTDAVFAALALAWQGLMVRARAGSPPAELQALARAAVDLVAPYGAAGPPGSR
ncbi:TetR/AcrR family transcriptional regulator [Mycobacterium sp.]|uniref:TetR/AcrR family transcriptional regulator n=1 Tax=Mycobacterium sp. TaxID=1785 RepID=UPI003BAAE2C8